MTPEVNVRRAFNESCMFELRRDQIGNAIHCGRAATMKINGVILCDSHAELVMTQLCGRNVQINRDSVGESGDKRTRRAMLAQRHGR